MGQDIRGEWIAVLAKLAYPVNPAYAVDALRAYLPLLADVPDGAFTARSAQAVALAKRKMAIPSYDEVRIPLVEWWDEHRPRNPLRLTGPAAAYAANFDAPQPRRNPPDEAEIAHVAATVSSLVAELRAAGQARQDALAASRPAAPPFRNAVVTDEQLLALCRDQVARGNQLAATRIPMLERKIAEKMGR